MPEINTEQSGDRVDNLISSVRLRKSCEERAYQEAELILDHLGSDLGDQHILMFVRKRARVHFGKDEQR